MLKFGVLRSVHTRVGQGSKKKRFSNYLLKLPWLFDGSVRNVFPSTFYCSTRCIEFIAPGKFPEREETFRHPALMGNCPTVVTRVSPIYQVDEFDFFSCCPLPPQTHTAASSELAYSL